LAATFRSHGRFCGLKSNVRAARLLLRTFQAVINSRFENLTVSLGTRRRVRELRVTAVTLGAPKPNVGPPIA
jgi:hypothetical protein